MGTLGPETNRKRATEELEKGLDAATQLKILLQNQNPSPGHDDSVSAEELLVEVLRSFTEALSVVMSTTSSCDQYSGDVCQIPVSTQVGSPSCGDRRSVNSGYSGQSPAVKDRRGCYKRRRTLDSWIIESPTMGDGHAWRKYGQKVILNAKFPRCYFRCTHKPDQGCLATKQVQIIQEDPQLYQTTYFGHHTCTSLLHKLKSFSDPHVDSYRLSVEPSKVSTHEQDQYAPSIKEECKEEGTESNLSHDVSAAPPPLDPIFWPDLMLLDPSASTSSHGLDIDCLIDFDNDFPFDEPVML